MKSKHTPGPWKVIRFVRSQGVQAWEVDGLEIAGNTGYPWFPNKADADLIAAAPDMLAALKAVDGLLDPRFAKLRGHAIEVRDQVVAALAKATGEIDEAPEGGTSGAS